MVRDYTSRDLRRDAQHDELVATVAASNGANSAEVYRLSTRSSYLYCWVGFLVFAFFGFAFPPLFVVALFFLAAVIKRITTLKRLRAPLTQKQKKQLEQDERAALKEELRREILKEELRAEIKAEESAKKSKSKKKIK